MLLAEYAASQLVGFCSSLPSICDGLANNAAGCGVGVGIRVAVVGRLVDLLATARQNGKTSSAPMVGLPFRRPDDGQGRQTLTRRHQYRRRWPWVEVP